jgi:hypothetical protein
VLKLALSGASEEVSRCWPRLQAPVAVRGVIVAPEDGKCSPVLIAMTALPPLHPDDVADSCWAKVQV